MKFTDTQFLEAVELIQTIDSQKGRNDKRRAHRTSIHIPIDVKLTMEEKTEWSKAKLLDISPRGAKLEMANAMEVGSSFLIRLPSPKGGKAMPLICRVAHCVKQRTCFLIGTEFIGHFSGAKPAEHSADDMTRIQQSILD
jgi:hypothetical protein